MKTSVTSVTCHFLPRLFFFENNDGEPKAPSERTIALSRLQRYKRNWPNASKIRKKISTCTKNFNVEGNLGELALYRNSLVRQIHPTKITKPLSSGNEVNLTIKRARCDNKSTQKPKKIQKYGNKLMQMARKTNIFCNFGELFIQYRLVYGPDRAQNKSKMEKHCL